MMETPSPSLGEQSFGQFAERYARAADAKAHNAYYDRPAVLSLLPDLAGRRVLDAGCGPGIYAEILAEAGAQVVAVDVTPAFVEITRQRLGARGTVLQAGLNQPLTFAADESFDGIIAPLVLDYLPDWAPVFAEFYRVLRPGGFLVFSCGHPMADWLLVTGRNLLENSRYFDVEQYSMRWTGFGEPYPLVTSYRRPLGAMINPLLSAGFRLETVLEPLPIEAFRDAEPEDYARLMRSPTFICFRASKG